MVRAWASYGTVTHLSADQVAQGLLGGADGLLVGARGAVGVIPGDGPGGRRGGTG